MTTLFLLPTELLKADDSGMCGDDPTALYCTHEGREFYNTVVVRNDELRHLGCSICDDHSDVYLEDKGSVGFRVRYDEAREALRVLAVATKPGQWKDLF